MDLKNRKIGLLIDQRAHVFVFNKSFQIYLFYHHPMLGSNAVWSSFCFRHFMTVSWTYSSILYNSHYLCKSFTCAVSRMSSPCKYAVVCFIIIVLGIFFFNYKFDNFITWTWSTKTTMYYMDLMCGKQHSTSTSYSKLRFLEMLVNI